MPESSFNSSVNHLPKPAWSFMALHSKSANAANLMNPSEKTFVHREDSPSENHASTQGCSILRKSRLLERPGVTNIAEDVSKPQFPEDQMHIVRSSFPPHMTGVESHGTKAVEANKTLNGSGFFASSLGQTKGRNNAFIAGSHASGGIVGPRHSLNAMPELRAASTLEKRINDGQASSISIPDDFPTSSKDMGEQKRASSAIKRDEASSEDLDEHRSRSELEEKIQHRSTSASIPDNFADRKGMHSLVLEAMKTVQKYESENEEQKQELKRLGVIISDLQCEKQKLEEKMASIRATTLQRVAASSQALKAQGEELRYLKVKSEELFGMTGECRTLLQEIQHFKGSISESIEAVQTYLVPEQCSQGIGSNCFPGLVTREILSALKNEIMNKQQVSDMLRDRLSDALSDVAALRTQVFQIQEAYSTECQVSRTAREEQNIRENRISELLAELSSERAENLKALNRASELETKLEFQQQRQLEVDDIRKALKTETELRLAGEKRLIEQNAIIQTQRASLELLEQKMQENTQLSSDLASRTERLKLLEVSQVMVETLGNENKALKNQILQQEDKIRDYKTKLTSFEEISSICDKLNVQVEEQRSTIQDLRVTISSDEGVIRELRNSLVNCEERLARSECLLSQTQKELATSLQKEALATQSEKMIQAQCLQVIREKEGLAVQVKDVEQRLDQTIVSREADRRLTCEASTQLKSFREQFEDQNMTLRLAREANAELQERLLSVIAEHTRTVEETRGNFRKNVAVLEERNISLLAQLDREKELAKEVQARLSQKEIEIEKYLEGSKQNSESLYLRFHQDMQALQEQKLLLQTQLNEAKTTSQAQSLESQRKEAEHFVEVNELRTALDVQERHEREMKELHEREQSEIRGQLEFLQTRLANLEKERNSHPPNHSDHEEETHRLRAQVHQLEAENETIKNRLVTLSMRYDNGDLDAAERTFVQKIMKGIQTVHDQETAKLKNELHRKDVLVVNLQEIQATLENSLRKKIQVKRKNPYYLSSSESGKKKSPNVGKSMIDTSEFINWPSSPSNYSVPSTHPGQQKDELTITPIAENQDSILRHSATHAPGIKIKHSPLNDAPLDASIPLQNSKGKLELELSVAACANETSGPEMQKPPKRPRTGGRNVQTYSSKSKRKRR